MKAFSGSVYEVCSNHGPRGLSGDTVGITFLRRSIKRKSFKKNLKIDQSDPATCVTVFSGSEYKVCSNYGLWGLSKDTMGDNFL